MKLYDLPISGNCYKIRLFCSLLGLQFQSININLMESQQKQPAFLELNPRGQIPVLEDGENLIWDSTAILVYLARKYAEPHWLASEPLSMARVMQWLAVAQNELLYGLARARAVKLLNRPWNLEQCQQLGASGLRVMEAHLALHEWLANEQISIADIACYPYVALAPEGGLSLDEYPYIRQWMQRMQNQPGYIGMPGL